MKHFVRMLALLLTALLLMTALTSCAPVPAKDADQALKALEDADYIAVKDTRVLPATFKLLGVDLTAVVAGTNIFTNDEGDLVTDYVGIFYFADDASAKKAMEEVEKYAADDKESEENLSSDWVSPTRAGNIIYYGTKNAIKAAK